MRTKRAYLAGAVASAALAALTAGSGPAAAADDTIRIGITFRMLEENGLKYGQLTVDEFEAINKAGGIKGKKIEPILLNDECKPDKGVANVNRLIHQSKVHLIIGSTCSSVTLPLVDITAKEQIAQVVAHSINDQITYKGSPWIFRVSVSERFSKAVYAKYAAENVGKKIAYLYTNDGSAIAYAESFQQYIRDNYKIEPVVATQVQETDLDFRPHLLKIKSLNPEIIAIAGQHDAMARMFQQAAEIGIPSRVKRFGSSVASNTPVPTLAGDAAKGVVFPAAFAYSDERPHVQKFVKMIQEKYKVRAPDHDFAMSYDTVYVIKAALEMADLKLTDASLADDRKAIRDALTKVKNYEGLAAGPINFCADPTPQCRDGNRSPVLIEYTKGGADYEMKLLSRVTFEPDFGLPKKTN